jgi:hypothetical protein
MNVLTTTQLIKQLTSALLGTSPSARERFILVQSLESLVRLAKSEYRVAAKRTADKANGAIALAVARRTTKNAIRKAAAIVVHAELRERDSR